MLTYEEDDIHHNNNVALQTAYPVNHFVNQFTLGLMTETARAPVVSKSPSRFLRAISGLMFFGAVSSFVLVFGEKATELGPLFQWSLAVAAVVTGISAIGIWMARIWGAFLYGAWTIISQLYLLALGIWTWPAPVVPGIILLLLFLKRRELMHDMGAPK